MALNENKIINRIDELFCDFDIDGVPGAAIAVIKDGNTVFKKGYGLANIETSQPFEVDTLFGICSITKQFTATCILLLEKDGRLSLDDSMSSLMPELAHLGDEITVGDLCRNTSGIRDYLGLASIAGYDWTGKLSKQAALKLIYDQQTLNFPRGERCYYSNSNFVILAQIIERLEDKPFGDVLRDRIFKPLGMNNSSLPVSTAKRPAETALAYIAGGEGSFQELTIDVPLSGEGGIVSTLDDLILWEKNFENNILNIVDFEQRLSHTIPLNDGTEVSYALGLGVSSMRGNFMQAHSGGLPGILSHRLRIPDQRLSVIGLFNRAPADMTGLTEKVAGFYLDEAGILQDSDPSTVELDNELIEAHLGSYFDPQSGMLFELCRGEENLSLKIMTTPRPLLPRSQTEWDETFKQNKGKPSVSLVGTLTQPCLQLALLTGYQANLAKLSSEIEDDNLEKYCGTYFSDELKASCHITVDDKSLNMCVKGEVGENSPVTLKSIGERLFINISATNFAQTVYFSEKDEQIPQLIISTERDNSLLFKQK